MKMEELIEQSFQERATGLRIDPSLSDTDIEALNLLLNKRIGTPAQNTALNRILDAVVKEVKPTHRKAKRLFRNLESTASSNGISIRISAP